ncbi:MAG: hypothetical protein ACT4PZ_13685 [Panacagrimonas sp.]
MGKFGPFIVIGRIVIGVLILAAIAFIGLPKTDPNVPGVVAQVRALVKN